MITILKEKLWQYIVDHNPDQMFDLQESYSVSKYLEDQVASVMDFVNQQIQAQIPDYIIQEQCMEQLTAPLKPSRFLYIRGIVEEEFPKDFERLKEDGTLTYELINMIQACRETFERFDFSMENEENRHLRYAIIAEVHDYLI
ncbi:MULTISPECIES: hypothetical protein [unclassified Flavobacterium]|uniref:hypothetical protein n=1 Tax=unclassified Flavobacterium TaxID=196869 RepID=UPI000966DA78|nr:MULTISPECIES: hypothetical protein [unclassified Flavobacterium]MBN9284117.1 hypothetical protein [Flavobacterium sp.]OJV71131.1 MAG: hypothetical protein BGO42_04785 [Flavobacterium sp. 40-81]